jgi:predicted metal-dependent peptidase
MSRKAKTGRRAAGPDEATKRFQAAHFLVDNHPLFQPLGARANVFRGEESLCPADGWALVDQAGSIHVHPTRHGEVEEWVYVLAHAFLHLGFGHLHEPPRGCRPAGLRDRADQCAWAAACDVVVGRFLANLKLGRPPIGIEISSDLPTMPEDRLFAAFRERGVPPELAALGTAGPGRSDLVVRDDLKSWQRHRAAVDWPALLGVGLREAATKAVAVAAGVLPNLGAMAPLGSPAQRARAWFVDHYPLLGALAAAFVVIEDAELCQRLDISVAAVSAEDREIYVNPAAGLDGTEARFVLAHELLHVGLAHHARQQGRDHYLWNGACHYVINGWLIEMGLGSMPAFGGLHDPTLKGESAEAIYDRITGDLRRYRKLCTLRGRGLGDILPARIDDWWERGEGCDLDGFYRRALAAGLDYHRSAERGLLPEGLVEEIRALQQPPVPWDVQLAAWFDARFPPLVRIRTYARPSRRQSATPDVPRPRWVVDPRDSEGRTFGVVLDTSGSMDRHLLAKALGAIAGYALSRDVAAVRVVFCDAAAYDAGYLPPEAIAGQVRVKGRGGTVLQPGIDLLETTPDFPERGPIMVITDGWCDKVRIRRDHAFILPAGRTLPFVPRGPVFRIR